LILDRLADVWSVDDILASCSHLIREEEISITGLNKKTIMPNNDLRHALAYIESLISTSCSPALSIAMVAAKVFCRTSRIREFDVFPNVIQTILGGGPN
jgi:hypothetical protein